MSALFPTYQRWEIEPESAKGSWLTDKNGKKYLDFTSGIGVLNLGHCHDLVKQAVQEQMEKFWHTSNMFQNSSQENTAQALADASGLQHAFFCNSGAEANEAAIKLARKATGKSKIVTFNKSFHGRTFATMAATGQEKVRVGFGPMLEAFEYVTYNDNKELAEAVDENTAAVMLEMVQGEGGIHVANQEFLNTIKEVCTNSGALIIVDEIQTGLGRTGKPFAFQHFDFQPDIVTIAKALGNGLPIGAMIGKGELAAHFGPGSHGSTFGGNPISIAAAEAVLKQILNEAFLADVTEKGQYLLNQLKKELQNEDTVKEVRGLGLMIGIELKEEAQSVLETLQEKGMLILTAGSNILRLLPPLTADIQEIDLAVEKISKVIRTTTTVTKS
ncbi:acetylornithine transaminase [Peribacillus cavernae]|uniref:Acetylornithine aminotransferase n=1 Tax=Peribacillus cavernae TaxID=1674310 RepID=A0A433HNZ4_9BACI|nr:acetylornithine transaminase [Peribacillus cavernae]MDQ0217544.1 acetylornithine aminotransferase [Peribacillus cavernae]RUQ30020.1 acetylornithine transaminase [Peribacillus cavernae]